ncbi:MAG: 16S rRNA (cytidine(1402)-2'-O)-methyltransferase [Hyphomicrobiaceae bacterium]
MPLPARHAAAAIERLTSAPLTPGLYLVATPIGHLADITLRALAVLARADVIYCEDTRHTRTLASHYGLKAPLRPYHEHNAAAQRPRIIEEMAGGARVALVSDAGTPLISDPGYKLVRDAVEAGHHVESLPGASAMLVALTTSGLPTDTFLFAGFLPPKQAARRTRLRELAAVEATLVFYEAPSRLPSSLADLVEVLGATRQGAVARELTKMHEQVVRGSLHDLARDYSGAEVKGEVAIVIAPPERAQVDDSALQAALTEALARVRLNEASREVARAFGVPRQRVYELGLALKAAAGEGDGEASG